MKLKYGECVVRDHPGIVSGLCRLSYCDCWMSGYKRREWGDPWIISTSTQNSHHQRWGENSFCLDLVIFDSNQLYSTLFGTCSFLHNVLLIIISFIKWSSYVAIYVLNGLYSCALFDLITNTSFWNHWCLHQVEWTWLLKSWLVYSNQLKGLRFGSRYTTHNLWHYWYMMLTVWHHLYIFVFYDLTSN